MSFPVYFYTFSKRENSTKRPDVQATSYNCIIRTGTGVVNPTIELDIGLTDNPSGFNYAYIPAFTRWYFVQDWTFEKRLWTARLVVDVMATYKVAIGTSNLYVLRASATYNNRVVDTKYPTKANCTFASQTIPNPWAAAANGMYVLGVVARNATFGSINYIAMTRTQLTDFLSSLIDDTITTANNFDPDDASLALQLALVDPMQYIKSCVFIPLDDVGGTLIPGTTIFNWAVLGSCKLITTPTLTLNYNFPVSKHPQSTARGHWVNLNPFTKITLSFPPFGMIELDTSALTNIASINVKIRIDIPSGKGLLEIFAGTALLNKIEGQVGVPIQLAQVNRGNAMDVGLGVIGGLQGNNTPKGLSFLGDIIGGVAGSIGDAMQMSGAKLSTVGGGGSFVQLQTEPRLDFQFFEIVDDDNAHNGRPLCEVRQPIDLGGYMLIQDGDIPIAGTAQEARQVRDYLEGGFYYE